MKLSKRRSIIVVAAAIALLVFMLLSGSSREGKSMELQSLNADEISRIQIENYPVLGSKGCVDLGDRELVDEACNLLQGSRFTVWDSYGSYLANASGMTGGFYTRLSFFNGSNERVVTVSYLPGIESYGAPGEGVCIVQDQQCYTMDDDQEAVVAFMGKLVSDNR